MNRLGVYCFLFLPLLSACSKGPSESDARAAVAVELGAFLNLMGPAPGGRLGLESRVDSILKTFKLNECKEASGRPGYVCSYSIEVNGRRQTDEGRFVKDGGGWKLFKS